MWYIKVDGISKTLELAPHTQLTYTITNPAFDPLQAEHAYTFSFTTPSSPAAMEITSYAERLDRYDILYPHQWPATLIVEGLPLEYGSLRLLKHTSSTLEWEFLCPGREILEKLAAIELTSLSEIVQYTPPEDVNRYIGFLFQTYETISPDIMGPNVWFEINIRGTLIKSDSIPYNTWNGYSSTQKNKAIEDFADLINSTLGFEIAFSYYSGLIRGILISDAVIELNYSDITVFGLLREIPYIEDIPNIKSLLAKQEMWKNNFLEANYDDEYNYCWPLILAPASAIGENSTAKKLWNFMSGEKYWFHLPQLGGGPVWKTGQYCPQPKMRWILQQLMEKVNVVSIIGDVINNEDIQTAILFSNVNMAKIQNGPFNEFNQDFDKPTIVPLLEWDLGWTMPAGSGKDFFITMCDFFGMYWRFKGEAIEFVKKVDQLRSAQEDWTSKCEPDWIREFVASGGQIIKYKEVEGIPPSDTQLLPYGTEGDAIELPANTLPFVLVEDRLASYTKLGWIWDTSYREFKAPYWLGPAVLAGYENGKPRTNTAPGFIFLFWRGMRNDSLGDKYGFASHDQYTYDGAKVGNLTLDMNAENNSIYDERWKDIFQQKNTHKITIPVRLGIADLINLKTWSNSVKRIYTPLGTILGVVMSVEATFISDIWQNEIVCRVELGVLR